MSENKSSIDLPAIVLAICLGVLTYHGVGMLLEGKEGFTENVRYGGSFFSITGSLAKWGLQLIMALVAGSAFSGKSFIEIAKILVPKVLEFFRSNHDRDPGGVRRAEDVSQLPPSNGLPSAWKRMRDNTLVPYSIETQKTESRVAAAAVDSVADVLREAAIEGDTDKVAKCTDLLKKLKEID